MSNTKKSRKSNVAWVVSALHQDLADGTPSVLAVRYSIEDAMAFIKGLIAEWVEDSCTEDISDKEAERLRAAWAGGTDTVFELIKAWNAIECYPDKIDLQDFDCRSSDDSKNIDCPV